MALNKVEYDAITKKMNDIKGYTTDAESSLKAINSLIEETVGASGTAWSGESAVAFKNSWDGIAEQFSSFVNDFNLQSSNIESLLSGMQAVDTTESGTVNQVDNKL